MKEIDSIKKEPNANEITPLKRVGNFIKEARLSRNQSIEELASNLKIGAHQLKAIEEGYKEQLPEEVFVKAMVRRIAQKLKLDTEFIMSEFKTERKEVKIEEIVEEVSQKPRKNKQSNNLNALVLGILFSGIFGIIASSFILNFFSDSPKNQNPTEEFINKN